MKIKWWERILLRFKKKQYNGDYGLVIVYKRLFGRVYVVGTSWTPPLHPMCRCIGGFVIGESNVIINNCTFEASKEEDSQ